MRAREVALGESTPPEKICRSKSTNQEGVRSAHRTDLCFSICRFSQVVFIPQAQPHAQSLFLFPIVFVINFLLFDASLLNFMCCGLLQSPSMSQRSFGHRDRRLPSEQALLWSCLVQRKRHMLPKDMNRFKTIAFAQLFQFLFPFTPSIAYVKSPKPAFTSVHETCEERRPVDTKRFSLSHAPRLVALDLRFYCRFQLNLTHPAVRVQPKR